MKRNWIIFILICVVTYIWMFSSQMEKQRAWQEYQEQQQEQEAVEAEVEQETERARQEERERIRRELVEQLGQELPDSPDELRDIVPEIRDQRSALSRLLTVETAPTTEVETDLYRVVFSELGARPLLWDIKSSEFVLNILEAEGESPSLTSVPMVPTVGDPERREYPLELVGSVLRDFNTELFTAETWRDGGGTRVLFTSSPILDDLVAEKEFYFRDHSYVVDLTVRLVNGPETPKRLGRLHERGFGIGWQGGFGKPQVADRLHGRVSGVIAQEGSIRNRRADVDSGVIDVPGPVDWVGQEKKYFTALIIPQRTPPINSVEVAYKQRNHDPAYDARGIQPPMSVELFHPWQDLETNTTLELAYQLYVGPKNREALQSDDFQIAASMTEPQSLVFHTIPLGLDRIGLRPICLGLLSLMRWLHEMLGIWGLAIIGTTIVVRTLIYPLTHWAIKNQARTMIEQQRIRPEMEKIQKKFKADPMKRNQAIMQLYRDHNVNPLGFLRGCFPILLQMPVFLALFVVFEQSVELRGQSFLWIPDLSEPDRLWDWGVNLPILGSSLNILPLLMGATNYLQMRIMQMPSTDEMQARIQKQMMILMPIVIVVFLYQLPSGLILYWTVSNVISIGQSYMTKRIIASHMAAHGTDSASSSSAAPVETPAEQVDGKKGKVRQGAAGT